MKLALTTPMVPDNFLVPQSHAVQDILYLPLGPWMAPFDYPAWNTPENKKFIEDTRGDDPIGSWLHAGIDEAQNAADLARHERDHMNRVAFAYGAFDYHSFIDKQLFVQKACVYMYPPGYWDGEPTRPTGTDWNFWTIPDRYLYSRFYWYTLKWLQNDWPWEPEDLKCTNKIIPD